MDSKVCGAATAKQESALSAFAEFIGADLIQYCDLGNGEDYRIVKDGRAFVLRVRGNKYDGGFMNVHGEDVIQGGLKL